MLNVLFRKPPHRVSHRWLSVFDYRSLDMTLINPLISVILQMDAKWLRETYEGDIKTIFDKHEFSVKAKAIINVIQVKMKKKKLITDKSKERKERIKTKLFYEKSTLLLNSILFMSVLELLSSFILTFEQKESL